MEHIHTLPQPWNIEDDFMRAKTWRSLGVDDLIDVSIPWSTADEVICRQESKTNGEEAAVLWSEYVTPAGSFRQGVRKTGEDVGDGWVVQPTEVRLFEDFNIPRYVEPAVSSPADIDKVSYLYRMPGKSEREWFTDRMKAIRQFVDNEHFAVQAWSAFGMDGVIWLTGVENAIMMAMDNPGEFSRLVSLIAETDIERTMLALSDPGIDLIVQRGWYSATDFWSPELFDLYVLPYVRDLAQIVHQHGRIFAYVMTTGIEVLAPRMIDAGVDVLYFVDPTELSKKTILMQDLATELGDRITLVGGISTVTLATESVESIRKQLTESVKALSKHNRFILHPVDALFPDTPWEGVETLIEVWKDICCSKSG